MNLRKPLCVAALFSLALLLPSPALSAASRPFASHPMSYAAGTIQPNHLSQAALDQSVRDFYDAWKGEYLAQVCGAGRYVVLSNTQSGNLTVSEAHGYGMMLAALMAGHDPDAQTIFDGMHAYFRDHPTATHSNLMSWYQSNSCSNSQGNDSASDGDLDIAFALLMADDQWGSAGAIDYQAEALLVLNDIKSGELDSSASYVLLGDWVTPSSTQYYPSTRTSDFTIDHYRSFANASGDNDWNDLIDTTYTIIDSIQTNYSASTGLLPDFIVSPLSAPSPASGGFLEGPNDGSYSYNAGRDPWRIATDYLVSGDARAKTALTPLNAWIRSHTGESPSAITAGYKLNGSSISGTNYLSMAFIAPFGVGAMVDSTNQAWLNDIWNLVDSTPLSAEGYFENTLKLLSMIVMSGNWWAPDHFICGDSSIDPGEDCDDGNATDGDGCDSNCSSTGCGNGIVTAGENCDDGNLAPNDCCGASCLFESNATACDDGEFCTLTDTCDGAGLCEGSALPSSTCIEPLIPGKSSLGLKDKGTRDSLSWKWGGGPEVEVATFGQPTVSGDYHLCIYEEDMASSSVLLDATAPASSSTWSDQGAKGFKFQNRDLTPDGLRQIQLKPGVEGKAMVKVKGKGELLGIEGLGFAPSATVTVQLHAGAGSCFSAAYSGPFSRNDSQQFKAKNKP